MAPDLQTVLRKLLEMSGGRGTTVKQTQLKPHLTSHTAALRQHAELIEWMLAELTRLTKAL